MNEATAFPLVAGAHPLPTMTTVPPKLLSNHDRDERRGYLIAVTTPRRSERRVPFRKSLAENAFRLCLHRDFANDLPNNALCVSIRFESRICAVRCVRITDSIRGATVHFPA
jgi:hypothetical protein